ncbi:STAS domain-containing protein [Novilysobacter spongiicola]|uniref:Phospholipid transport system transporter-binding protein n=1 Tax=Lysobacter spongiicola DSM 21749 TaxID=1122188 RepID=A0A1T4Q2W5_9GAMM|nr:phospholipid transport system transporter-binding protein [Lysobacter spongiicola DSM 21749]
MATDRANSAGVVREGDALVFTGPLDRAAVPALWTQAAPLAAGIRRFDLAGASSIDSAGLAMLAELAGQGRGISIEGDPVGLAALRDAYRLDGNLAFAS